MAQILNAHGDAMILATAAKQDQNFKEKKIMD